MLYYVYTQLASFPYLPTHPQRLYTPTFRWIKVITRIMFAGEREGLGTRLEIGP